MDRLRYFNEVYRPRLSILVYYAVRARDYRRADRVVLQWQSGKISFRGALKRLERLLVEERLKMHWC